MAYGEIILDLSLLGLAGANLLEFKLTRKADQASVGAGRKHGIRSIHRRALFGNLTWGVPGGELSKLTELSFVKNQAKPKK